MKISGVTYVPRKTSSPKKALIIVIAVILVLSALLTAYCGFVGWSLTHPGRKAIVAFAENSAVPKYEDISFYDINNKIKLSGWYFNSPDSVKTVILAHGYTSNRLQFDSDMPKLYRSFVEKGYNVLSFDFRNSGKSDGKVSTVGYKEKYDLLGAIKYAKERGSKHIILMGFSMGASTSILAAAESKDVEAVIADTPFESLDSYLNKNLPIWSHLPSLFNKPTLAFAKLFSGVDTSDVSPISSLESLAPRPLLLIHGTNDPVIPLSNSEDLYKAYAKLAGSKAELWTIDVDKHVGSYKKHATEYMSRVFEFLEKNIPSN